jgi:hypothetical protein
MKRVEITSKWLNVCAMQVCAEKDATDEEILDCCNKGNPSGTTNGWTLVIRTIDDEYSNPKVLPVACEDYPERIHFIVIC